MAQPDSQGDRTKTPEVESLEFINQSKQFLNKEFLTWLWFFAENNSGPLQLSKKSPTAVTFNFYIWIDDRLILESNLRTTAQSHQNTFKGGDPSRSPEASVALIGGKVVKELKFGCKILPYGDFTAILSGTDLNPRSLTLPKKSTSAEASDVPTNKKGQTSPQSEDDSDPLTQRLLMMQAFTQVLDHLVGIFMKERIKNDYESETAPKIRQWMQHRRENRTLNPKAGVVH